MAKFVEKIGKYSEYILKGFSFLRKKSPIENKATLKEFLLTRAAFISQKTLYGYIKTRAGTKYVTIFNDDRFNNSVNIAKWNIYILCLSDLTLYSINYINSQMKLQDTHNIFQWYNEIFTEELGNIPIEINKENIINNFTQKLSQITQGKNFENSNLFQGSAASLVKWAPVSEQFKKEDEEIVLNSMKFKWKYIRDEFLRLLRTNELIHNWDSKVL